LLSVPVEFARSIKNWNAVLVCSVPLLASAPGSAGTTSECDESVVRCNDSFEDKQIINGQLFRTVTGEISDLVEDPDLSLCGGDMVLCDPEPAGGPLSSGMVHPWDLPGLAAGPFIAWIVPIDEAPPATLLGSFLTNGNLIDSNDDASPVKTNPALQGKVNSDGTIQLKVTGSGDVGFNGAHTEMGSFDLLVTLGTLDLDYFSFQNLKAAARENFTIELDTSDPLKSLVWFDDSGAPSEYVFNQFPLCIGCDEGFEVQVPENGILNFAVTGGEDDDADGFPSGADGEVRVGIGTGSYTLELTIVPEPSETALALSSLLVLARLVRKRRAGRAERSRA
jgi:hypothetical protein